MPPILRAVMAFYYSEATFLQTQCKEMLCIRNCRLSSWSAVKLVGRGTVQRGHTSSSKQRYASAMQAVSAFELRAVRAHHHVPDAAAAAAGPLWPQCAMRLQRQPLHAC